MTTVGIIGGKNGMGKWFANFFLEHSCEVQISDLDTEITNVQIAQTSDIILVAVPISVTNEVIAQITPHVKQNSLLMDVTSLKAEPVKLMSEAKDCEVLGTHPMFGPMVSSMEGQTIIFCEQKKGKWTEWVGELFTKSGARIKQTTPQEHDHYMSVIQVLTHCTSIGLMHTLSELGVDIKESLSYTSPVYKISLSTMGRILNQNPQLYADIELSNPESPKVIDAFIESIKKLQSAIHMKNKQGYIDYFKKASEHIGEFKREAQEESDYIIEQLARKCK